MKAILTTCCIFLATSLFSQSNINQSLSVNSSGAAADASAMLDVQATDKGMLVPRMTSAQRTAIASPATGLLVFDTTTDAFWFYNGAVWADLSTPSVLADADGDTKIQVEESPDEDIIRFDLGGMESMVLGRNAAGTPRLEMNHTSKNLFIGTAVGDSITTGISNTASGTNSFSRNKTGSFNTATGYLALTSNTEGDANSAYGAFSLRNNTTGDFNTAFGHSALAGSSIFYNTGEHNTAIGRSTLYFNRVGNQNTAVGSGALYSNDFGNNNTAIGTSALSFNTSGNNNTANGMNALYSNAAGNNNTANGFQVLYSNTTGSSNTANGMNALQLNTTGSDNTATGTDALHSFNTGSHNTANGRSALLSNTTGDNNTAIGSNALALNTSGSSNTASGRSALFSNTAGSSNTANGFWALFSNTIGDSNTANGRDALKANTTGNSNTASGYQALLINTTGDENTASGRNALVTNTIGAGNTANGHSTGSFNDGNTFCTFIGRDADQTVSTDFTNSTALGSAARITNSNQVRIGNSSVSSIGGYAPWTDVSDLRFKRNLQADVPGLGFILKLRPVTYNLDAHGLAAFLEEDRTEDSEKVNGETPQKPGTLALLGRDAKSRMRYTGFVAQEVEQAAQSIGYDFSGVDKPQREEGLYGLRYSEFVVPLVKAVQEQQAIVETLKTENAALQSQLDKITAALQGAGIAVEK